MRVRRLALWLLLFVAVDFGTPFIGGAFTFDAETSAEGLGFHRDRAMARSEPALMPLPVPVGSELVSRRATEQTERTNASALRWVTMLPRARILPEPPSAPSDDH